MKLLFSINYYLTLMASMFHSAEKIVFHGRFHCQLRKSSKIKNLSNTRVVIGRGIGPHSNFYKKTKLVMSEDSILELERNALIGGGSMINLAKGAQFHLGEDSYLCSGTIVGVQKNVYIGKRCSISWNVTIMDDDGHDYGQQNVVDPVRIEDEVWVGCNVTILKGVTLGKGCVVAAGSVVTKSFPANSVVGGVPAKLIREGNEKN